MIDRVRHGFRSGLFGSHKGRPRHAGPGVVAVVGF